MCSTAFDPSEECAAWFLRLLRPNDYEAYRCQQIKWSINRRLISRFVFNKKTVSRLLSLIFSSEQYPAPNSYSGSGLIRDEPAKQKLHDQETPMFPHAVPVIRMAGWSRTLQVVKARLRERTQEAWQMGFSGLLWLRQRWGAPGHNASFLKNMAMI